MKRSIFLFLALIAVFALIVIPFQVGFAADSVKSLRGLSTDTKPTAGLSPGSTFLETNTSTTYVLKQYPDGTRAWVTQATGSATTYYLAALSASGSTAITATADELNKSAGAPASITTTATPATGTCGVQFVFNNAAGAAISRVFSGMAYVSSSAGAHSTAVTSLAALTNGSLSSLVTGKVIEFTTTSAGLLGITLTGSAGTYYITFVLPGGVIATSSAIVVN